MRSADSASIRFPILAAAILALAPVAARAHGHGGGGHHGAPGGSVVVVRPGTFGGPWRPMSGIVYPRSPGFSPWPWSHGTTAPLSDATSAADESARESDVDERIRAAEDAPTGGAAAPSHPLAPSNGDTEGWQPL